MHTTSNPRAVLLASPGAGHLIPVLELGNSLSVHHGFDVTILVVTADSSTSESPLLGQSPATKKSLSVVLLPPVDISSLVSPAASVVTRIKAMIRAAVPSVRAAITAMSIPPTALVVDFFGTEVMVTLAREFNMLSYVFITTTAWFLAVTVHIPSLGEREKHEHCVLKKPLKIPGCRQVWYEDTLDIFRDQPDPDLYPEIVRIGVEIPMADGILVNTWRGLETSTLNELNGNESLGSVTTVPVYPIGPLVRPVEPSSATRVMAWLDKQPKKSVIYVSFGSGGTLSAKQTIELAWGLELCRQRFVWVVRPPVDDDASAAFFNAPSSAPDGTPDYLPEGFFNRTGEVGLVVPLWAPQAEVLAHASVGAFLSHCGWNSTLESVVNGVPMVAWPLYAEQKMNARMLKEETGTAVRLGPREAGAVVGREEIRDVLVGVMDGGNRSGAEIIRARAEALSVEAKEAVRKGGSSYFSLSQVAKQCQLKLHRLTGEALGA